ncbi:PhoH family protein [Flavobacteriaceae bacterium]|uniref:PhoH family protein n=1 Tax=Candidatus Arcticimaribacter forsetii TaxID=2820661 RepID=UPI00207798C9|nr:PhoH family protein [Candidatus Arcticimaribacter forsetii]MDB2325490.1 PhoH family protein [Flavobacteriaceae bacterium]MDB2346057.1 PhoH family protein [Flavobacteriaceae bacterium]MDB4715716.1 PhoH family protein [Flavobacteriaceae bacterium]MDB4738442.1 PhoH family protein [Flavobacteriaceae bacterium]
MNEIEIQLQDVNPRELFGDQNSNVELLRSYFPKLKIVARGSKLKAFGEEAVLDEFEMRIDLLISHFRKYNKLDQATLENILTADPSKGIETIDDKDSFIVHGVGGRTIKAQTINQQRLVQLSKKNDMLFAVGPAGTGKTYTSVALAVKALKEKQVKRIILTRPAVEAGENLGFLPGDMKEKLDPYMQPLYDALRDMIPAERLSSYIEKGTIQIAPLAFMRGRTLDHAFVILDEAQNTTHAQMKMFLTRMGTHAKFIITGDPGQIDLPRRIISGLKEALLVLKETEGIGMIYLDDKDVIRHKLVRKVIEAYKNIEHTN